MIVEEKTVEHLVVDTTAFIQNAPLQQLATNIYTTQDVVDEIVNKRQLRRLCVLPYDLQIKHVYPESIQAVTDFAKKTGDYPSLSATDLKVMALTYQLEKEHVGVEHIRPAPVITRTVNLGKPDVPDMNADITGFYTPKHSNRTRNNTINSHTSDSADNEEELVEQKEATEEIKNLEEKMANVTTQDVKKQTEITDTIENDILVAVKQTVMTETIENDILVAVKQTEMTETNENDILVAAKETETIENDILVAVKEEDEESDDCYESYEDDEDDEDSWITPSNIAEAKKQVNSELMEVKKVKVACITTDFAMQNVLKQMNLNVSALDGRLIKQLRTFILRCYTCFGTTSVMTKQFCGRCGNNTLKKVAVSLDETGRQQIHINTRRPLTGRGKRFSIPTMKGGKHANNPRLVEDQPMPDQKPTRMARMKNNPMADDYIAGYSPFVARDVNSRSAKLCIRPGDVKQWMRRNPNEARRQRKK